MVQEDDGAAAKQLGRDADSVADSVNSVTWADRLSTAYLAAASSSSWRPSITPCSSTAERIGVSFAGPMLRWSDYSVITKGSRGRRQVKTKNIYSSKNELRQSVVR